MTFSILWAASASRSAAASIWSVQVTPIDDNSRPASAAPSRVPRMAAITRSGAVAVAESSSAVTSNSSSSTVAPSAYSPSSTTIWIDAGAIDTPSTISKPTPPKVLRARPRPGGGETTDPSMIAQKGCAGAL